jgi:enoyl-CoA hydratase/carnithine racemase
MTRLRLNIANEQGDARLNGVVIDRLLAQLEHADKAAYVTIESDGPSFCDGMDLSAPVTVDARTLIDRFAALLHAIEVTPRPVIALVGGRALGGGVGLAAAADIVIASPDATFGLPETLFGLIPAVVLPVVARRIGPARARWLAVSARVVSATDAWRFGLVDDVSDPESGLATYVHRLERLDTRAIGELKAIAATLHSTPDAWHEDSVGRFCRLAASPETRDRVDRFLAGDTPWPDAADP